MSRRLPSLNALRCFEIVAAQMSVKRAATLLCISESAVSRQIRILEEQLGLALFLRTHNGLDITEAGKALAASVGVAFDEISRTVKSFQRDDDTLTLKVVPTFALRWLYPRLKRFQAQHPLIRLVVQMRWHDMASGDGDAELGIRYGLGNWSENNAIELYPEWLVPVCAPTYLGAHQIRQARDFEELTLLHPLPSRADWQIWSRKWGGGEFNTDGGMEFDVLDMALRSAEAGFGIAISDVILANDSIVAGTLVMPVSKIVQSETSYFLVFSAEQRERRQVRIFCEWIVEEMRATKAMINAFLEEAGTAHGSTPG